MKGGSVANLYWPKRSMFRSDRAKRRRFAAHVRQAVDDAKGALVVSHGGCLDGAGSAVMVLRRYGADRTGVVFTQPSHIQNALALIAEHPGEGRVLHITDLSLNANRFDDIVESVRTLKRNGWRIEWRDHHEKQWEELDLEALESNLDVLEVNDDHTESGASLVQKALLKRDKYARRLADTIKDRDLWINDTPDSETLEFAINHMGTDRFMAHCLSRSGDDPVVDATIRDAAEAERKRIEADAKALVDQARYWETGDGEKVGVVYGWLPKNVGLHRVLEQDGVQVAVNVRPNGHMSLRSRKGADVCQKVAKEFEGGGHPNASGGTLGLRGIPFWTYVLGRGRTKRVQEVAEKAVDQLEAREEE